MLLVYGVTLLRPQNGLVNVMLTKCDIFQERVL